jgi:superfamily I DNA/RNA helicase
MTDRASDPIERIVSTEASRIHIIAGPGTGKTFALENRVQGLLDSDVEPSTILAITFTRSGALDLRNKLMSLDDPGACNLCVGTLHSYALQWLIEYGEIPELGEDWRLIEDYEIEGLLHDMTCLRLFGNKNDCKDLWKALRAAWARNMRDDPGWGRNDIERRFDIEANRWLELHRCMHIGQAVPKALMMVRRNPELPLFTQYRHVIVDEYQDLNRSDQELIDRISRNCNLMIVGDDDQSIYRTLRHANPDGLLEYLHRTPDSEPHELHVCRRCPRELIDPVNALIENNNPHRIEKILTQYGENPAGILNCVQFNTRERETNRIADYIRFRYANEGDEYLKNTIILVPVRKVLGVELLNNLQQGNPIVPSVLLKSSQLSGNKEVLKRLALLRQSTNPGDRVSIRTWIGLNMNQYGRNQYSTILQEMSNGASLMEAIELCDNRRINTLIQEFQEEVSIIQPLQYHELLNYLFPNDNPEFNDVRIMIQDLEEIEDLDCAQLCEILHSRIREGYLPDDIPALKIMTFFEAKGLTSKNVIIIGASTGLAPKLPETDVDPIQFREEQRRLFYVALTRARNELLVSSFYKIRVNEALQTRVQIRRQRDGFWGITTMSPFLGELGPRFSEVMDEDEFIRIMMRK